MGDAERAELHKSMLAYTGMYRVEGSDFITTVKVEVRLRRRRSVNELNVLDYRHR
jgi:hypothetical protein